MPNNLILRRIDVTPEWKPLSPVSLVGTVDVSTPPSNSGPVFFRAGPGEEVFQIPGEAHSLVRVDLADISVSGQSGDIVTLIGGTW